MTVPHIMVRLERMLDYRGVGLERFYCTYINFISTGQLANEYMCEYVRTLKGTPNLYLHAYFLSEVRTCYQYWLAYVRSVHELHTYVRRD